MKPVHAAIFWLTASDQPLYCAHAPQRTYLRHRDGANFLPAAVWHGPQSAQLRPTAAIAREVNLQAAARDYYAVSAVAAVLSDLLMLGGNLLTDAVVGDGYSRHRGT